MPQSEQRLRGAAVCPEQLSQAQVARSFVGRPVPDRSPADGSWMHRSRMAVVIDLPFPSEDTVDGRERLCREGIPEVAVRR